MSDRKMNLEDSEDLANWIRLIGMHARVIDLEYLKLSAKAMGDQASFQDAAALVAPSHVQLKKNELVHFQAKALHVLVSYIETLKEIDKIKQSISELKGHEDDLKSLFL